MIGQTGSNGAKLHSHTNSTEKKEESQLVTFSQTRAGLRIQK